MDPRTVRQTAARIRGRPWEPRRGSAEGIDPIEIVNLYDLPSGGFPALIEAALRTPSPGAQSLVREISP